MATLYTIGHGRRSAVDFMALLRGARIERLVDVRALPGSRRNPQFSRATLAAELSSHGIDYEWQGEALGGFRKGAEPSAHTALRDPMFRAYAEHMETGTFADAAQALASTAEKERTCIMCAESDPARCHRSLIADWLVAHGHAAVHLLDAGEQRAHAPHPQLRIEGSRLLYCEPHSSARKK